MKVIPCVISKVNWIDSELVKPEKDDHADVCFFPPCYIRLH